METKKYGWDEVVACRPSDIKITKIALPFGWMGNMAPQELKYADQSFFTSEALFQWLRFESFEDIRKNRALLGRGEMWDEAESDIELMRVCLRGKLAQHPYLAALLVGSDERVIVEDCTARPRESAAFWGAIRERGYWRGRNVLGNLWMELRAELREKSEP
jgi:predicted NAD-dependent protein-ADP-ribosyltransferase YbiA (DUF1768 family)